MDAAEILRQGRRRADLSQRELSAATGIPQSTIGRIEAGHHIPRVDTLDRLLRGSGEQLVSVPIRGAGIDRSQIAELLRLTPAERLELTRRDAASLTALRRP